MLALLYPCSLQVVQQVLQRRQLTVDVSHDVERAGGQGLDQAHGGKAFNEKTPVGD